MNMIEDACVVFTGVFPRVRREIEMDAKLAGMWVESQVTRRTRYLVTGINPGGTKVQKAEAYGVEIIDYRTYLAMAGVEASGHGPVANGGEVSIDAEWLKAVAKKRTAIQF